MQEQITQEFLSTESRISEEQTTLQEEVLSEQSDITQDNSIATRQSESGSLIEGCSHVAAASINDEVLSESLNTSSFSSEKPQRSTIVMSFLQSPSSIPDTSDQRNQESNLGRELLTKINKQITTLQKEQKGFFAANKGRKKIKVEVLNQLIQMAKLEPAQFVETWTNYINGQKAKYSIALAGKMSTRTRSILLEVAQKISTVKENIELPDHGKTLSMQ